MRKSFVLPVLTILVAVLAFACSPKEEKVVQPAPFEVYGEFLFEGPNTLQAPNSFSVEDLQALAQSDAAPKSIRVSGASFQLNGVDAQTIESATLQIVSKNHSMISLGTISVVDADVVTLNMAEETDVTSYLTDEDATWILDVNLTQDFDELDLPLQLEFAIN